MWLAFLAGGYFFIRAMMATGVILASSPSATKTLTKADELDYNQRQAVTVIVVTRNNQHTIAATLDSLLASQGVEIEYLIVVDNCSTDDTVATIEAYAADVELNIDIIKKRKLSSFTQAAVTGFTRREHGQYVLFLDGQTTLAPTMVATQVSHTKNSQQPTFCVITASFGLPNLSIDRISLWLLQSATILSSRASRFLPKKWQKLNIVESGRFYLSSDFNLIKNMSSKVSVDSVQNRISTKTKPRSIEQTEIVGGLSNMGWPQATLVTSALFVADVVVVIYFVLLALNGVFQPLLMLVLAFILWLMHLMLAGPVSSINRLTLLWGLPLLAVGYVIANLRAVLTSTLTIFRPSRI